LKFNKKDKDNLLLMDIVIVHVLLILEAGEFFFLANNFHVDISDGFDRFVLVFSEINSFYEIIAFQFCSISSGNLIISARILSNSIAYFGTINKDFLG
jgi:hypothetical protein